MNEAQAIAAAIAETEEDDVRRLAEQLTNHNMVSVAFLIEQNKCTEPISCFTLFDSGSPRSFISNSLVPFNLSSEGTLTQLYGMGNKRLSTYGTVKCKILFRAHELIHDFIVLPDDETIIPLLIGVDLLNRMRIHLCQLPKIKYNVNELKSFNKEKPLDATVISALTLFNLYKSVNARVIQPI